MPPVKHSYFGASSSERWITCPGSVTLCAKAPKTGGSSSFANEGTAAHELAEKSLLSRRMPINFYGETILVEGTAFVVDNEMVEAVTMYVNEVLKVASKKHNPGIRDSYHIETKFNLRWFSGRDDMFGTCDACVPDTANRTIHVFDLKYGAGKPVYAENNTQLMYYALGILGKFGKFDEDYADCCLNFDKAVLHIIQPRCDESGVSEWEISIDDLFQWGSKVLLGAVEKALSENPPFNPTPSACRWCAGKPMCKAYADSLSVTDVALYEQKEIILPPVETLSDAQIARILEVLPMVKSYMTSVGEYALARALDGNVVPGYKLVRGRKGNRKWGDEKSVEDAFGEILGEDLYDFSLKSPAQVEKLLKLKLGKEMDKNLLEPFVTREEGSLVLAPESDKREAVEVENKLIDILGEEVK